jgi:hypothetical protein
VAVQAPIRAERQDLLRIIRGENLGGATIRRTVCASTDKRAQPDQRSTEPEAVTRRRRRYGFTTLRSTRPPARSQEVARSLDIEQTLAVASPRMSVLSDLVTAICTGAVEAVDLAAPLPASPCRAAALVERR